MNFFNRNIELILNQCCGFDNKAKARGGGGGGGRGGQLVPLQEIYSW